jgi:HEPN domain-containing protein
MNVLVDEWIQKAEGDFISALRDYRARKFPNFDAACFHAQQCIEKYLKALLQKHEIRFKKTHDLLVLKELCVNVLPDLEFHIDSLSYLSQFAVAFRYPGETAGREDAKRALKIMKELRSVLRTALGLTNE